jgi:hypothetical protein
MARKNGFLPNEPILGCKWIKPQALQGEYVRIKMTVEMSENHEQNEPKFGMTNY